MVKLTQEDKHLKVISMQSKRSIDLSSDTGWILQSYFLVKTVATHSANTKGYSNVKWLKILIDISFMARQTHWKIIHQNSFLLMVHLKT